MSLRIRIALKSIRQSVCERVYCMLIMGLTVSVYASALQPKDSWMRFSNVHKISYHSNKSQLEKIAQAEKKQDWVRMKRLLASYISKFGIENFYKDTKYIWKLAKLTELLDGLEQAKPLYRLVLRHHHEDIALQEIEPYYHTFNEEEIGSYVPLEYYYKLVEHQRYVDTIYAPRSRLLNMGNVINSEQADYAPFLNSQNNLLVYTSKRERAVRNKQLVFNEDIYISRQEDGFWEESNPLLEINTQAFNEGSVCLNSAGDKLYFARCNAPGGLGDCDIYVAYLLEDSNWGNATPLGAAVNSPAWDSHPSLSPSGDTLYFASDRVGGFGLSDIYFSTKDKKGAWKKAKNLGPIINTRSSEVSPFLHAERRVLYFSSRGQLYNFGGFDIYRSDWQGTHWGEPLNIGPLVNGTGSEHYFTIDSKFLYIYYAKSLTRDMRGQDIYSFPLPMEAHPDARTLLRGSVQDSKTGRPIKGIVSIIDLDKGIEISPKYLSQGGTFSFKLIDNRNYLLVIQGDDFFRIEELFYLSGPREIHKEVAPVSRKIEFKSIEFETAKADITDKMKRDLDKVVKFMSNHKEYHLNVSGHTDGAGSSELNVKLSQQRAENIRNYIVEEGGISAIRLKHKGYGSSKPIVEEKTEADKAINRRVEFHIYSATTPAETEEENTDLEEDDDEEENNWE